MKRFTAILFTLIFMATSVVPSYALGASGDKGAEKEKTTLTAELEDVTVTAVGIFPDGAELTVRRLPGEASEEDPDADKIRAAAEAAEKIADLRDEGMSSDGLEFWDIRILSEGKEYASGDDIKLSFDYSDRAGSDETLEDKYSVSVYHAGKSTDRIDTKTKDNTVTVKTGETGIFAVDFSFTTEEKTADDAGQHEEQAKNDGGGSAEDTDAGKEEPSQEEDGSASDASGKDREEPAAAEPEEGEDTAGTTLADKVKKLFGGILRTEQSSGTDLPVTVDGLTVEKAVIKWRSVNDATLSMKESFNDMPFQIDIATSGRGTIDVGAVEIVLPAYIWKTRDGEVAHRLTLGVPEISAAETSSSDFAYRKSGDKVYITNIKKLSAAMKISIDGTYRTTAAAHAMKDGSYSDDLYAEISMLTPHNQSQVSVTTNSINATIDTSARIYDESVSKEAGKVYRAEVPDWANNYKDKLDGELSDYVYVEWKVTALGDGTQAYDLYYKDRLTDGLGGIVLGLAYQDTGYDSAGEWGDIMIPTGEETEDGLPAVKNSSKFARDYNKSTDYLRGSSHRNYVLTAYPRKNVHDGTYILKNEVTARVKGVDSEDWTEKTVEASTKIDIKTPETYTVKLVWELNEGEYSSTVEERTARIPKEWGVSFFKNQTPEYREYPEGPVKFYYPVNPENDWTNSWTDDGIPRDYIGGEYRETKQHELNERVLGHLVRGKISERVRPDGKKEIHWWWFDTRKKVYDEKTKTWTIYNDYHEGVIPEKPVYETHKIVDDFHHMGFFGAHYIGEPYRLDINRLNRGLDTTDIDYELFGTYHVLKYTYDGQEYTDPSRLKGKELKVEILDHEQKINEQPLDPEDFYISHAAIAPPRTRDYIPESADSMEFGTYSDYYYEPFTLYGLKDGNEWIELVKGDKDLNITTYNEAEMEVYDDGMKYDYEGIPLPYKRVLLGNRAFKSRFALSLKLNRTDITQLKLITATRGAEIDAGMQVGMRLRPTKSNLEILNNSLMQNTGYTVGRISNSASFSFYDGERRVEVKPQDARAFIYGKAVEVGARLEKESETFENDIENKVLRSKQTIKLDRKSDTDNPEVVKDLYSADLVPDTWSGTFYDLLPAGTIADLDSLSLTNGKILSKELIENWRSSGRSMLKVKVSFKEDGTYWSGEGHVVWKDPELTFELLYPWEEAKSYGLDDIRNLAVYVADEDSLGNMSGWTGDKDSPDSDYAKTQIRDDEKSLVSDLYDGDDPRALYAGRTIPHDIYDFTTLTELRKFVKDARGSSWSDGTDDKVSVVENGSYQYRLVCSSGADTTTRDVVLIDVLENYHPMKIDVPGDSGLKAGTLISSTEFEEINAKLSSEGKTVMTGSLQTGWQGSFKGVNVSELERMGVSPVVYYSTKKNIDVSGYATTEHPEKGEVLNKLVSSGDWSTTPPADLSKVTAVAFDCTKKADGSEFTLGVKENLIAYIYMKAPAYSEESDIFDENEFYDHTKNRSAFNGFYANTIVNDPVTHHDTSSYNIFEFTRTDIYAPKMKVVKKWDDNKNNDGKRPEEIEISLHANGRDTGKKVRLTKEDKWEADIGYMPLYDADGGMLYYSAAEGDVPDYVPGDPVMDAKDGIISLELTNIHKDELTDVNFTKTWAPDEELSEEDRAAWESKIPEKVTFRLYDESGTAVATKTLTGSDFEDGNWSGVFKNVRKYDNGSEIQYRVVEEGTEKDWHSEQQKDGDGNINVSNFYYPYGSLEVTKKLLNATEKAKAENNRFTFRIRFTDSEGEYGKEVKYRIVRTDGSGTSEEGTLHSGSEFTIADDEKLVIDRLSTAVTYDIEEKPCEGYTLTGSEDASGSLTSREVRKAEFTNTYSASCELSIGGTKTLDGRELKRSQFRFELRDENGRLVSSTGNNADGSFAFGDIEYSEADAGKTFKYSVTEVNEGRAGYTYDGTKYYVYVTPVDDGRGSMSCKAIYKIVTHPGEAEKRAAIEAKLAEIDALDPDAENYETRLRELEEHLGRLNSELDAILANDGPEKTVESMSFANTYRASGNIALKAYKTLLHGDLSEYHFMFDLYDQDGNLADEEPNGINGIINFYRHFDQDDAGRTFYYIIKERAGTLASIQYDKSIYGYRVKVIDNNNGTLAFDQAAFNAEDYFLTDANGDFVLDEEGKPQKNERFEEKEGSLPVFRNEMGPGGLSVSKFIDGNVAELPDVEKDREFEFVIKLTGDDIEDKKYDFDLEKTKEQQITVNFVDNSGGYFNGNPETKQIRKTYTGTSAGTLLEDPSKDRLERPGYAFEGWFLDEELTEQYRHDTHLKNNTTLYAKWVEENVLYTDGTFVIAEPSWQKAQKVADGKTVEKIYKYAPNGYVANKDGSGDYQEYLYNGGDNNYSKIKRVEFGTPVRPRSLSYYFRGLNNAEVIDLTNLDSSDAVSMQSMFSGVKVKEYDNIDPAMVIGLDTLNTSKVTNMKQMFLNSNLKKYDVYNFDTSNVTDMEGMFRSLYRRDAGASYVNGNSKYYILPDRGTDYHYELDVSSFDTSKVTKMNLMFADGHWELREIYASDRFKTDAVTDSTQMFRNDKGLGVRDNVIPGTENKMDRTVAHTGEGGLLTYKEPTGTVPEAKTKAYVDVPSEIQAHISGGSSGEGEVIDHGSAEMKNGEMRVNLKAGQAAVFNNIPAGTAYQVYENTPDGWTLIRSTEASGKIIANEIQAADFHNKYETGTTSVQFSATKLLDGKASDTAFDFGLYEVTGQEESEIQTVSSSAGGAVSFEPIKYSAAGTHVYKIREINKNNSSINYDNHEETITVVIAADNGLKKTVTYSGDGMTWRNTTKPGVLEISKSAYGTTEKNSGDEFTVTATLEDTNGVPNAFDAKYYIVKADGSTEGSAEEPLTKNVGSDGTFRVKLKAGEKAVIINGPAGSMFRIEETDLPDGWTLSEINEAQHHVTAGQTSSAVVTNSYHATGEAVITAHKKLDGRTAQAGEFVFELQDKDGNVIQTSSNMAQDNSRTVVDQETGWPVPNPYYGTAPVSFMLEGLTLEDAGKEYTYYIVEKPGNDSSVTYDTERKEKVTVSVEDDGEGYLKADVKYDEDGAVFTNNVKPGDLVIENEIRNATAAAADTVFTFRLTLKDRFGEDLEGSYDVVRSPAPKLQSSAAGRALTSFMRLLGIGGTKISSGDTFTLKGGESISISGLPDGTQYAAEELDLDELSKAGWTLMSTDNTKASVTAGETQKARFVNIYRTEGEAVISAAKELRGAELAAGAYSFELIDEEGRRAAIAENEADGSITIRVPYAQSDDGKLHRYILREATGSGDGISYDRNQYEVSVSLADNGRGEIEAEVEAPKNIKFVNRATHELTVSKTVGGELGEKDREFSYTLSFDEDIEDLSAEGLEAGEDGEYSFTLKDGETISIAGIPHGAGYTLTEEDSEYSEHVNGRRGRKAVGTITEDTAVEYVNILDTIPQTKVDVRKVWEGTPERYCTVELHQIDRQGNDRVIRTERLTAGDGWTHSFTDIPRLYENEVAGGKSVYEEYSYRVTEVPIDGWKAETKFDESSGTWVITNSKTAVPGTDGSSKNGSDAAGKGIGTGDENSLLMMTAAVLAALLGIVLIARRRSMDRKQSRTSK